MTLRIFFALTLALLALGCAPAETSFAAICDHDAALREDPTDAFPEGVTLLADPRLGPEGMRALRSAAQRWNDALPGRVRFRVLASGAGPNDAIPLAPGQTLVAACDASDRAAVDRGPNSVGFTVASRLAAGVIPRAWWSDAEWESVLAHELGHVLGLGHAEPGSDALMRPTVYDGERPVLRGPEAADLAAYADAYGPSDPEP